MDPALGSVWRSSGFGRAGGASLTADTGPVVPVRCGWATVAVGSQLRLPIWLPPVTPRTRRNAAAWRRLCATARDAGGRAESAVAERLDDIPAAAGTALTGRALTAFGRARQDQQAEGDRARVDDLGRRRADPTGTRDSSLGEGQDHAVSEWQPGRRNNDRPYGQRPLIGHGVVVPGWPPFAGAVGRHRSRQGIMNTVLFVFVCGGRWAGE